MDTETRIEVGPELDIAIGERIMGWRCEEGMMHGNPQRVLVDKRGNTRSLSCGCGEDWNPSVNLDQAMEVVATIGMLFILIWQPVSPARVYSGISWRVDFCSLDGKQFHASANTPTEAICRAAMVVAEGKHD